MTMPEGDAEFDDVCLPDENPPEAEEDEDD